MANMPSIQDPFLAELGRQMAELQQKALEYQMSKLPEFQVKVMGFGAKGKETVMEMQGSIRLDYLLDAQRSHENAMGLLLDGLPKPEAARMSKEITKVWFLIEGGAPSVVAEQPSAPPPPPPEAPTPSAA